ncbi:MAG: hypothetical protein ABJN98_16415 [Roseibium sp.]
MQPECAETDATPVALTLDQATLDTLSEIVKTGAPTEQCLAIKALQSWRAPAAKDILVEATRNEDPDVRVDALEALVSLEANDLGAVFLWSLENDPVGESKVSALRGLHKGDLKEATDLIRKLVLDRCEDEIAWEDDTADWDDWLDIQKEAIRAVGRLGIEEAVPDLLNAANDEFGQDLWIEVMAALSDLGRPGLMALIDAGQSESERQRARAARALETSVDELAGKALDALSQDKSVDVRLAAIETLLARKEPLTDDRLIGDEAAVIRRFAAAKSLTILTADLVKLAIEDDDKEVRLSAIRRLVDRKLSGGQIEKLCAHVGTKLRGDGEAFVASLSEVLGKTGSDDAFESLKEIKKLNPKADIQRAVLNAMANFPTVETLEAFSDAIASKSQMVRLSALAGITALTKVEGELGDNAAAILLLAARGDLGPEPEENDEEKEPEQNQKQFGSRAQDDDGSSKNRVVIDREGNIVPPKDEEEPVKLSDYRKAEEVSEELEEVVSEDDAVLAETPSEETEKDADVVPFPTGTLAAIMQGDEEQLTFEEEKIDLSPEDLKFLELAQNTLEKKRVRPDIAPDAILDVRRVTVRLLAGLNHPAFTQVLLSCTTAHDNQLRSAAFNALAARIENGVQLAEGDWEAIEALPPDSNPAARANLLGLLAYAPEQLATDRLHAALRSREGTDQVAALAAFTKKGHAPEKLGSILASNNRSPRQAALKMACRFDEGQEAIRVVEAAFLESGALGSDLAKAMADRGACQLTDDILVELVDACQQGSYHRMIALQILSKAGEVVANA